MSLPCGHEFEFLQEIGEKLSACSKCGTVYDTQKVRDYSYVEGKTMKKIMGIGEGENKKEPLNG